MKDLNSEDQIIERLDQWWKAFITNKFGKKSESKTKKFLDHLEILKISNKIK